ncbi:MAG: glycosyltransferase [Chitinophagales bacterium]|nr:glycosyltransferase [Chitinophagales bacterium]MDW8418618.1 glycosyltransferase [Chitinophagales bacterium]
MAFISKYDTPAWKKRLMGAVDYVKYNWIRPVVAEVLYYGYYQFTFPRIHKTVDGKPLKPGISVYIPMKDEDTFLTTCLESLLDIVDQYILIDNGSTDNTLKILHEFKDKYGDKKDIVILHLPDKLLVEIVQIALTYVKHHWVLKWDGDMVAVTEGDQNLITLRKKIIHQTRPVAYTLPRMNLCGDFFHVPKNFSVIDAGEPFLRTFNNAFRFFEDGGRVEHAIIPKYYRLTRVNYICSVHLSKIRPLLRLIYREMYLDWREVMNRSTERDKKRFADFEVWKNAWKLHNFGTTDERKLKFRVGRLFATMSVKNTHSGFRLPTVLQELVAQRKHKFEIEYRDGAPYRMVEIDDVSMQSYQPDSDDLAWEPSESRYYSDKQRFGFTDLYQ